MAGNSRRAELAYGLCLACCFSLVSEVMWCLTPCSACYTLLVPWPNARRSGSRNIAARLFPVWLKQLLREEESVRARKAACFSRLLTSRSRKSQALTGGCCEPGKAAGAVATAPRDQQLRGTTGGSTCEPKLADLPLVPISKTTWAGCSEAAPGMAAAIILSL